jgi:cyanophycinase
LEAMMINISMLVVGLVMLVAVVASADNHLLRPLRQQQQQHLGKNFSLVLVGGGLADENDDIWGEVITLAGGKGVARIGVIAAAGENPCCDPDSSFVYYQTELLLYGAAEVVYLNLTVDTKSENSNPEVISLIKQMTGFFFTGGDQQRVIASLYNDDEKVPSPALIAIKETLLATGGVVAGTSAGTDCQTINTMISNGESYEALAYGTTVFWRSAEFLLKNNLSGYGPGGIGLFPHGLLDTHFANRGRVGRMIELMVDTHSNPVGSTRAFGIDENTAVVVTGPFGQRVAKVIGERGVLVLDTASATVTGPASSPDRLISNIRAHRISVGDVIDLNTLSVTVASFKEAMAGKESAEVAVTSTNVFEEGTFEFDSITQSLFASKATSTFGVTKETQPQIKVTVSKSWNDDDVKGGRLAQAFDGSHPGTNAYCYTYTDLNIRISAEK